MTCRTDENTETYSVPTDGKEREIFFVRGKLKFLNRGITENCGKIAVNCGPESPPPPKREALCAHIRSTSLIFRENAPFKATYYEAICSIDWCSLPPPIRAHSQGRGL